MKKAKPSRSQHPIQLSLFVPLPIARGSRLTRAAPTGRVRHDGKLYEGQHEAIITQEQFEQVHAIFEDSGRDRRLGKKSNNPSLLMKLLTDPDGGPMRPEHTVRSKKRYRYYATRFQAGEARGTPWRMPAGEIERAAILLVGQWLRSINDNDAERITANRQLADRLAEMSIVEQRAVLLEQNLHFELAADKLTLLSSDGQAYRSLQARLVTHGQEKKLELPPEVSGNLSQSDPVLIKLLAQARAAQKMVLEGSDEPIVSDYSKRHFWQLLRISWLTPDIVSAIVAGRQPAGLTGRRLLRASSLPLDWAEQREFLGFS